MYIPGTLPRDSRVLAQFVIGIAEREGVLSNH